MWSLILLLLPLAGAGLVLCLRNHYWAKRVSLGFGLAELFITLVALFLSPVLLPEDFDFSYSWIPAYGINLHFTIDGISVLMVLLTNLLIPFILFSGIHRKQRNETLLYSLMLFTQFALIGVFTSLNAVIFYVFWEMALVPVFFILFLWGGERRHSVTLKFFIYSLFGSLFLLIVFIYLYFHTLSPHSFEHHSFTRIVLEPCNQFWVFWMLLLAFIIKIPLFPTHSWQPGTYTVAPWQGSMLLGGLLMKMGIYGLIRWVVPVIPVFTLQWGHWMVLLALIGMVYFSVIALFQQDFKTLIAFSSLAHGGLMGAAVFSLNVYGLQGVLFQSFSHGILIILLFYFAQLLEERTNNLNLNRMGGIKTQAPLFAALLLITVLGSVGLPLTNGFPGEMLMILGLFSFRPWTAILGVVTLIVGAIYMLYAYQQIALGEPNSVTAGFPDLNKREKVMIIPLVLLIVLLGIFPQILLTLTGPAVSQWISFSFFAK